MPITKKVEERLNNDRKSHQSEFERDLTSYFHRKANKGKATIDGRGRDPITFTYVRLPADDSKPYELLRGQLPLLVTRNFQMGWCLLFCIPKEPCCSVSATL